MPAPPACGVEGRPARVLGGTGGGVARRPPRAVRCITVLRTTRSRPSCISPSAPQLPARPLSIDSARRGKRHVPRVTKRKAPTPEQGKRPVQRGVVGVGVAGNAAKVLGVWWLARGWPCPGGSRRVPPQSLRIRDGLGRRRQPTKLPTPPHAADGGAASRRPPTLPPDHAAAAPWAAAPRYFPASLVADTHTRGGRMAGGRGGRAGGEELGRRRESVGPLPCGGGCRLRSPAPAAAHTPHLSDRFLG